MLWLSFGAVAIDSVWIDTDRVGDVDDRNDVLYGGRRKEDAFSRFLLPPLPPPAADAKYGKEDERTAAMRHMVNSHLLLRMQTSSLPALQTADYSASSKKKRSSHYVIILFEVYNS